jgi:flagellar basal body rod protein FlgC
MRCLQDRNQSNVDNLNHVRREASRHLKKKKKYLKAKLYELVTNSKMKTVRDLYRDFSDFKKGYQPRTNIVKDEKSDLVQTPTVFWLGGRTISLSCYTYKGLVVSGRQKYIQ